MTYSPAPDASMPIAEQDRALDMLNAGEITADDFEWLMGADDPEESDVPKMSAKKRKWYFARQASLNRRAGIAPAPRKRRKKAS